MRLEYWFFLFLASGSFFACTPQAVPDTSKTQTETAKTELGGRTCSSGEVSSANIVMRFSRARTAYESCLRTHDWRLEECLKTTHSELDISNCSSVRKKNIDRCLYDMALYVNALPEVTCNAKIYEVSQKISLESFQGAVSDVDTDGDGLSNFQEFMHGLNPCATHTFGPCQPDDFTLSGMSSGERGTRVHP